MPKNSEKNKEICESLWQECEPHLRQICNMKLASHPSEVDDIISEAFAILLNALSNDKDIRNPKNWLYGTVKNLIKIKYEQINK